MSLGGFSILPVEAFALSENLTAAGWGATFLMTLDVTFQSIPEPSTIVLALIALFALQGAAICNWLRPSPLRSGCRPTPKAKPRI
jgi:hypothetical protein